MNPYQPIPVDAAANIGHHYNKSTVVIFAQDHAHQKTHVTTWGREPKDKLDAAEFGDRIAAILAPGPRETFADFRTIDAANIKANLDKLNGLAREFLEWIALNPEVETVLRAADAPLSKLAEFLTTTTEKQGEK